MKDDLIINGILIPAGKRTTVTLPMPKLYDWTSMSMPLHIIRSKKPGPILCITGALHGDELNGTEIIRRLLKKSLLKKLSGTIIAAPIVNIYGFLYQDRYLMDRRDLNRSFPGSKTGSLAARLAYLIMNEIVAHGTHFIDLHTGSLQRTNLPQIRANLDIPGTQELAEKFNAPVILHSKERDGSLRQAANDKGRPLLLYEAGEALRFSESSIRIGLKGILNILQALNMIPDEPLYTRTPPSSAIARSSYWIRAPHSGILRARKSLGRKVKKNDLVGIIVNPIGSEEYEVRAPHAGIIIGQNNSPLVHEGAAMFNVAAVMENHLEDLTPWTELHD